MASILHGSARTTPRVRAELQASQDKTGALARQYERCCLPTQCDRGLPYKLHTVLTDNGMAFADLPKNRHSRMQKWLGPHIFDRVCVEHGIQHKLTKPYHPWTNGQAERMNRTIKDATIKAFHYPDLDSLKAHVLAFVSVYNFAKHLKALRWRTPFQAITDAWLKDHTPFKIDPRHLIPGPNT